MIKIMLESYNDFDEVDKEEQLPAFKSFWQTDKETTDSEIELYSIQILNQ